MTLIRYDRHGLYTCIEGQAYRPTPSRENSEGSARLTSTFNETDKPHSRILPDQITARIALKGHSEIWYRHLDLDAQTATTWQSIERNSDLHWNPRVKKRVSAHQNKLMKSHI